MIQIRDGRIEDMSSLLQIYNWAVRNTTATFDLEEHTLQAREEWFSHFGDKYPLLVAEDDGEVLGYSCYHQFRDKEAYAKSVELSVYIDEKHHGRGVGKALMAALLQRAEQAGIHALIAGITAGNEASVKLHERFGFEQVGIFKEVGYKFDTWQDVLFYQLILPRK